MKRTKERRDKELARDVELTFRFGTSNRLAIVYWGFCLKCFHPLSWSTERSSRRRNYRCMNTGCTFTVMFPKATVKWLKEHVDDLPPVRVSSL